MYREEVFPQTASLQRIRLMTLASAYALGWCLDYPLHYLVIE